MGLFNFVTKNFSTNKNNLPPQLSDVEIAFLQYANGHDSDINIFTKRFLNDYNLDYKKTLQKLLKAEFIQLGTPQDSLTLYKVSELKIFLSEHKLPISGKKDTLIQRIISHTNDYDNYFPRRIYTITDTGKKFVDEYEQKFILQTRKRVLDTISYIRTGNFVAIYQIYGCPLKKSNSASIPYEKSEIQRNMDAIGFYRKAGHDTDREMCISVVSLMDNHPFRSTIQILQDLGYNDISNSEVYTISTSLYSICNILGFTEAGITKYEISACNDSRTCQMCKKMDGKIYPISKAVIGKTLPPFCSECRCLILAKFE